MAEFDSVVPPGGTGKIVARVDTKKFEGRRTKTVTVRTNDPATPQVVLRLTFDARPAVHVLPARYARLQAVEGRPAAHELLLRRDDGAPLEIASISVSGEGVVASVVDPSHPDAKAGMDDATVRLAPTPADRVLRIALAEGAAPGTGRAVVTVRTNVPAQPEIAVPVHVRVRPLLTVSPDVVVLEARPDAPREAFVSIVHGARRPFEIRSVRVEGELPGVTAEAVTSGGPVQRLRIVAGPSASASESSSTGLTGEIVIETSLGRVPELRVPVRLRIVETARENATR